MEEDILKEFYRLFAKTNKAMDLYDVAENINFAINSVPSLLKDYPDNKDLRWMIKSFMRRSFRSAIRVTVGASRSEYAEHVADDLAKKAGFHQYKSGDIVSIFDCVELENE